MGLRIYSTASARNEPFPHRHEQRLALRVAPAEEFALKNYRETKGGAKNIDR
jgi:hypothetical protein